MYEMCVSLDIVILTIHDYLREKGIPLDEYHESIFKHTKEDCDGIVELLRTKLSVVEQAINRMYGDIEGQVLKEMDGIEV
jgi:DNA-binding transcriptional MerR regulator